MHGVSSSLDEFGSRRRLSQSATECDQNWRNVYVFTSTGTLVPADAACAIESACRGPVVSRLASTSISTYNDEQAQGVQQSKHERYSIETKGINPSWFGGSGSGRPGRWGGPDPVYIRSLSYIRNFAN